MKEKMKTGESIMPAFVKFNLKSGRSIYKWVFLDNDYDYPTDTFAGNTFTKIQQLPDYQKEFYENISPEKVATISNDGEIINEKIEAELKKTYAVLDSEYDLLPMKERWMAVDMRGHMPTEWLLNKREVAVVGKLYVRGRVSGDWMWLTHTLLPLIIHPRQLLAIWKL